jgi:major type 1 subunit fimbrin (pilin)
LLDHGSGRLNVDKGAAAAANVQIEIANGDGKAINMYTEDSQGVTIAGHGAEIPLIARYYANGKVTEGEAKSRINFQVVYE